MCVQHDLQSAITTQAGRTLGVFVLILFIKNIQWINALMCVHGFWGREDGQCQLQTLPHQVLESTIIRWVPPPSPCASTALSKHRHPV